MSLKVIYRISTGIIQYLQNITHLSKKLIFFELVEAQYVFYGFPIYRVPTKIKLQ